MYTVRLGELSANILKLYNTQRRALIMSLKKIQFQWFLGFALTFLPAVVFAQSPTSREYPYLYKSPRAMGMGGAYTAIGGRVDSLFYNPAGLSNIPKDKGWEVNILNPAAGLGSNTTDFMNDMQDALDTTDLNGDGATDDDQMRAVNEVLAKNMGENLHLDITDFTSIGKSFDRFAFGVGGLVNARLDAMAHQGFGPEGFLEVNADATYGPVGGFSYGVTNNLFAGLSLKLLKRESLVHNFTTREFVEKQDTLDKYITDELRTSGSAFGADAGVIYKFAQDSRFRPLLGLSIMNIGDLNFGDAGKIPMTINAGVSANPQIPYFRSLVLGMDYVDIANNYSQDKDMWKRLRYGGELQLFDILPAEMAVRAGMYEGSPTFGVDLRLLTFMVSYVKYSEEVGAYAGQDKDERQIVQVTFGW
jgi:hypothetical protein